MNLTHSPAVYPNNPRTLTVLATCIALVRLPFCVDRPTCGEIDPGRRGAGLGRTCFGGDGRQMLRTSRLPCICICLEEVG